MAVLFILALLVAGAWSTCPSGMAGSQCQYTCSSFCARSACVVDSCDVLSCDCNDRGARALGGSCKCDPGFSGDGCTYALSTGCFGSKQPRGTRTQNSTNNIAYTSCSGTVPLCAYGAANYSSYQYVSEYSPGPYVCYPPDIGPVVFQSSSSLSLCRGAGRVLVGSSTLAPFPFLLKYTSTYSYTDFTIHSAIDPSRALQIADHLGAAGVVRNVSLDPFYSNRSSVWRLDASFDARGGVTRIESVEYPGFFLVVGGSDGAIAVASFTLGTPFTMLFVGGNDTFSSTLVSSTYTAPVRMRSSFSCRSHCKRDLRCLAASYDNSTRLCSFSAFSTHGVSSSSATTWTFALNRCPITQLGANCDRIRLGPFRVTTAGQMALVGDATTLDALAGDRATSLLPRNWVLENVDIAEEHHIVLNGTGLALGVQPLTLPPVPVLEPYVRGKTATWLVELVDSVAGYDGGVHIRLASQPQYHLNIVSNDVTTQTSAVTWTLMWEDTNATHLGHVVADKAVSAGVLIEPSSVSSISSTQCLSRCKLIAACTAAQIVPSCSLYSTVSSTTTSAGAQIWLRTPNRDQPALAKYPDGSTCQHGSFKLSPNSRSLLLSPAQQIHDAALVCQDGDIGPVMIKTGGYVLAQTSSENIQVVVDTGTVQDLADFVVFRPTGDGNEYTIVNALHEFVTLELSRDATTDAGFQLSWATSYPVSPTRWKLAAWASPFVGTSFAIEAIDLTGVFLTLDNTNTLVAAHTPSPAAWSMSWDATVNTIVCGSPGLLTTSLFRTLPTMATPQACHTTCLRFQGCRGMNYNLATTSCALYASATVSGSGTSGYCRSILPTTAACRIPTISAKSCYPFAPTMRLQQYAAPHTAYTVNSFVRQVARRVGVNEFILVQTQNSEDFFFVESVPLPLSFSVNPITGAFIAPAAAKWNTFSTAPDNIGSPAFAARLALYADVYLAAPSSGVELVVRENPTTNAVFVAPLRVPAAGVGTPTAGIRLDPLTHIMRSQVLPTLRECMMECEVDVACSGINYDTRPTHLTCELHDASYEVGGVAMTTISWTRNSVGTAYIDSSIQQTVVHAGQTNYIWTLDLGVVDGNFMYYLVLDTHANHGNICGVGGVRYIDVDGGGNVQYQNVDNSCNPPTGLVRVWLVVMTTSDNVWTYFSSSIARDSSDGHYVSMPLVHLCSDFTGLLTTQSTWCEFLMNHTP